ncbi:unnamed protein product, partial [Candidula unifasciata]
LMRPLQMIGLCRSGCAEEPLRYIPPKSFTKEQRMEQWEYVNSIYFGPERDMKNFPNPSQPESSPAVRVGIIPASWFNFLYPKTGVTGPFALGGGLALFMLSKEIMVIDHYFWEIPSFWGAVWFVNHKFGHQIRNYFDSQLKLKKEIIYSRPINQMKANCEEAIRFCEKKIEETETATHLYLAKKENVELQLEAAYRQRLLAAYQEVKKRLDYETARSDLVRKFEQDHMVDWIESNVTKSITPQQEQESIQSCIRALKKLAAKENVSK